MQGKYWLFCVILLIITSYADYSIKTKGVVVFLTFGMLIYYFLIK